jgi:hypothetical protein
MSARNVIIRAQLASRPRGTNLSRSRPARIPRMANSQLKVLASLSSREWRNWQTRWLQVPVFERTWGFKSPLAHRGCFRKSRNGFHEIQANRPVEQECSAGLLLLTSQAAVSAFAGQCSMGQSVPWAEWELGGRRPLLRKGQGRRPSLDRPAAAQILRSHAPIGWGEREDLEGETVLGNADFSDRSRSRRIGTARFLILN